MSSIRGKDDRIHELRSEYEAVQKKTFTKWANSYLKERGMEIMDLYGCLKDGRILIALLERLSNEELVMKRYYMSMKIVVVYVLFLPQRSLTMEIAF
jgi:hypothetical protein